MIGRGSASLMCRTTGFCVSRRIKWVTTGIYNLIYDSKNQQRGWSYAASVPSDMPNSQKRQKRVSKDKRKAMVASFVDKYKAMNGGKFPTITNTVKQVGGSHYTVREILQELEHKSKMQSSNCKDETSKINELTIENKLSMEVDSSNAKDGQVENYSYGAVPYKAEIDNAGREHLEEKRGPETSFPAEVIKPEQDDVKMEEAHYNSSDSALPGCYSREDALNKKPWSENKLLEDVEEILPASLLIQDNVKREEAQHNYSGSALPEGDSLREELKNVLPPLSEKSGIDNNLSEGSAEESSMRSSLSMQDDVKREVQLSYFDSASPQNSSLEGESKGVWPHLNGKSRREFHRRIKQGAFEDLPDWDGPKCEEEQSEGSVKSEKAPVQANDAEIQNKSTLWGNLKSLADGIMNIWRKL